MAKFVDYMKRLIYREGMTPLPTTFTLIMFINIIFYSMISTILFSFLPKMVKYFGSSELETGYYAGMIASSIFVGRFLFSLFWGYLCDTISKKYGFLSTGLAVMVTTLVFGFSRDFYWAATARFLQGCSMGQIVVFKSILADVCDDTNMALGLSVLMTAFSFGRITGPSLGGFLVFPAEQYPTVFSKVGIFGKFGILLPNFVLCVVIGLGVLLGMIFIPNDTKRNAEKVPLMNSSNDEYGTMNNLDDAKVKEKCVVFRCKNSRFIQVLTTKESILCCLLYGMFPIISIGFIEMFPVLAATSPKYNGMEFSTAELSAIMMISPAFYIIIQIAVVSRVTSIFGSKKTMIGSCFVLSFICPMLPNVAGIADRTMQWICLILILSIAQLSIFTGYLAINILINNSVDAELLGTVNGVGMAVASIGRLIAPVTAGSIYSWSLTNIENVDGNVNPMGFPFNQYLTFYALSGWAVIIAVFAATLPDSMDLRKK